MLFDDPGRGRPLKGDESSFKLSVISEVISYSSLEVIVMVVNDVEVVVLFLPVRSRNRAGIGIRRVGSWRLELLETASDDRRGGDEMLSASSARVTDEGGLKSSTRSFTTILLLPWNGEICERVILRDPDDVPCDSKRLNRPEVVLSRFLITTCTQG